MLINQYQPEEKLLQLVETKFFDDLDMILNAISNLEKKEFDEIGWSKIGGSTELPAIVMPQQLNLYKDLPNPINLKLKEIDPNELTPKEALNLIFELCQLLGLDS